MMNNLVNQRFGRLIAVEDVGRSKDGQVLWRCPCDCGNEIITKAGQLRQGKAKSCGCLRKDYPPRLRHGWARGKRSSEWLAWRRLKQRCLNPNHTRYAYYGGRGIKVCDRWLNSFENFIADMGPKPTSDHSIDRADNDGDYEPGNCQWVTKSEQMRNRRALPRNALGQVCAA
jgi:hypothetical protein